MRTGRPQTPAVIRELTGARTRKHHRDRVGEQDAARLEQEPRPQAKTRTPFKLTREERVYWNYFAPLLAGAKMLTPADQQTLADYCRACVAVDQAMPRMRTAWKKRSKLSHAAVAKIDAAARNWIERKTKLAGELGLTAMSRTRLSWTGFQQQPAPTNKPSAPKSRLQQLQEQARELRKPVAVRTNNDDGGDGLPNP